MNVVHVVCTDAFAGVERYVSLVSNGLAERGHRVTVIGGDPVRMSEELRAGIEQVGASSLMTAAAALVRRRGADIVHVHMTAAEGAAWLARPRARVVSTRHFAQPRGSSPIKRRLAEVAARTVDRQIAISQFVADHIEGPATLVHSGVPEQPAATLDHARVVMLQRLECEKDPDTGIRAWAASGLGGHGWRLVVAGSGDRADALAALAEDLGVGGTVEFVGHVSDTDTLLAGASIFLAPPPAEPFGLSVVEAMAHGIPVVAADGGAHGETLGTGGCLFPPGDAEAAGVGLASLAGDIDLRLTSGARLRMRQHELFSIAHHLDRLELVYREVVAGAAPDVPFTTAS